MEQVATHHFTVPVMGAPVAYAGGSFLFTVINLPPEAKYWAARFDIEGREYWLGILTEAGKFQTYPVAGSVDAFHVFLYDLNQNYLGPAYAKSLYYGIAVTEGGEYQFDWSTSQFKGIERPEFSNLKVSIVPDYIRPGDFFYVTTTFDYSGPDIIGALAIKVAIGKLGILYPGGFKEVEPPLIKLINVYGPANSYEYTYTYQSLSTIQVGNYDLLVAIGNYPWDGTVYARKLVALSVIPPEAIPDEELPPGYQLIQHTIYPYAYIYDGDDEVTIATFKTDPFTPAAWMGDKFASKLEEEVRARGGRALEVKVYVDTTPLFWTDFRVEVVGTPLGAEVASGIAVGIPIWAAILIIALAIIAVIVVATLVIKTIVGLFKTYPGLEDVKPGWGKETLMLTIHDSEEHWERPLTPTETLGGMSEAELRDHLDQIAEEEVAPEVSWWPLAVIGGLVVIGGGAVAIVYAMGKPRE